MSGDDVAREPCPRCKELIAVGALKCRFCGYEQGPSLRRFVGMDMTGMSPMRRTLNVVGFAALILIVLLAVLSY